MAPTRRAALAAIGGGLSSALVPASVAGRQRATAREQRHPGPKPASRDASQDGSDAEQTFQIEWEQRLAGEMGWHTRDAAPNGDGGVVAACNLIPEEGEYPAAKLVDVAPDGSTEVLGTLGYPQQERVHHWFWAIEPAIDDGYVLAGYEMEFNTGEEITGFEPKLVHVDESGEETWSSKVPGVAGTIEFADPRAIARVDDQYVVAATEYGEGAGTVVARFDADGTQVSKWSYSTDNGDVHPVDLQSIDGDLLFLGAEPVREDSDVLQPFVARLALDGTNVWRTTGSDGGYPYGFARRGDSILVVGTEMEADGPTAGGWAMKVDATAGNPMWEASKAAFGMDLVGAAAPPGTDGWVFSGRAEADSESGSDDEEHSDGGQQSGDDGRETESVGRLLAGANPSDPQFVETPDGTGTFEVVVPAGDGSAYAVGRAGTLGDVELDVIRLSTPLDPEELSVTVEPKSVDPGEEVSLSVDSVGAYDVDLLETSWSADDSTVGETTSASTSFESPGDHTVTATVSTRDGRSESVERTVTVEGETVPSEEAAANEASGGRSDSLPGFGVLAAGGGLAGAALYERVRGRDD